MMDEARDLLTKVLDQPITFHEKRPGIMQIFGPFYHDDGDMLDIFITEGPTPGRWTLSDFGMTMMRLSYSIDVLPPCGEALIEAIACDNGITFKDGILTVETAPDSLSRYFLGMISAIASILIPTPRTD